ncbi:enoyl-CoA hydratase/isomerase family protein [Smaragdicoccus niigatensis]|uniref:enoyl-CoA hydratase/isomerase family protein n=1 Tax=Smaragdicoccus niigatensis TaxID=359359 RepID=UPI00037FE10A|nr:enoyl-CoA hydratase/isomerase family protein [Smaragdicoccus niigatensis]
MSTETSPSPSGKLLVSRDGQITTITLNRPECHNALDKELSAELNVAIKDVSVDRNCRILVIRGSGNTFCAGDDIKDFTSWVPEDLIWQIRQYQETVNLLENLVPITIAAVDGICTGGGLELTLACDFVVATDRSRWGMPEINWAITPGWGGVSRLGKFAGRRKTKEWNMIGGLFDAATAERYDLVNRLCLPETLDRDVNALIETILDKDHRALHVTKYYLNKAAELSAEQGMWFEGAPQRPLDGAGILDFVMPETRERRRNLAMNLWQD